MVHINPDAGGSQMLMKLQTKIKATRTGHTHLIMKEYSRFVTNLPLTSTSSEMNFVPTTCPMKTLLRNATIGMRRLLDT